ncbi:MAG: AraC family transcriptional regulator, partial [Xanthomonadales bacterium]|nr:AraC family transcriptional regulator [Xanthomonadales bacterium]
MSHAPFFAIDPAWKQLLGRLQINVDTVLTHAGLQQDLLGRATVGLSTAEMFALWEALEAIYRGDDLLLRIFENFQSDSFSP